jgi:hypothetical protein
MAEWERSAIAWLFDVCPPDYRAHDVLRKHPIVLSRFAAQHVAAAVQAARDGLRTVRAELSGLVTPEVIEAAIAAYEREGRRLVTAGKQIEMVAGALRGERWIPRL